MDIPALESFVLASDRAKALAALVPGSDDHYRFQALAAVHDRDAKRLKEVIAEAHQHTGSLPAWADAFLDRLLLVQADRDPAAVRARIEERFGLEALPEAPTGEDAPPSHPDALPPDLFDPLRRLGEVGDRWLSLTDHGIGLALGWAAAGDLSADSLRALLQRVRDPGHPQLVELLLRDLRQPDSGGFGSLPIHGLLTLAQYRQLADLAEKGRPRLRLRQDERWVQAVLARMRPAAVADDPRDAGRQAWLAAAWQQVQDLPPAFCGLQVHILHHLLDGLRRAERPDLALFMRYLQLPRAQGYVHAAWLERQQARAGAGEDHAAATGLPPVGDDSALVVAYLGLALDAGREADDFAEWLDAGWLRRTWAELRILRGGVSARELAALASQYGSAAAYQALVERIEVALPDRNRLRLDADAPAELLVTVKNVPRLVVKVFRINTVNHVLAYGRDIDGSLDLDGLVANQESELVFAQPPQVRHDQRIPLPACAGAGTWVVEVIGQGVSSRAIIRKGALQAVWRVGAAGQVVTILDGQGRELPSATLLVGGRTFARQPGDDGIVVPFAAQSGAVTALLVHGDLATPWPFQQLAEDYALDAGLHIPADDLRGGATAQVLVRARLHMHGHAVGHGLIEAAHLDIATTDLQGVETSARTALELAEDGEAVHRFPLPVGVQKVAARLTVRLKRLDGSPCELSAPACEHAVATIDAGSRTGQLLLLRGTEGYRLQVCGRNGEPRPGRMVEIACRHRWYPDTVDCTCQSDAAGMIGLGQLPEVVAVTASLPDGFRRTWSLAPQAALDTWPERLFLAPGQAIELPWSGGDGPDGLGLLRLGWQGLPLEEKPEAIALRPGVLALAGLEAGDYLLRVRGDGRELAITVAPEAGGGGWLRDEARLLRRSATPLVIRALEQSKGSLRLQLGGHGEETRVHLVAGWLAEGALLAQGLAGDGAVAAGGEQAWQDPRIELQNGRDLGDEYRYIIERARQAALPGIMLARPGLLLNPWAMRGTSTSRAEATAGSAFGAPPAPACAAPRRSKECSADADAEEEGGGGEVPTWDFLAQGATVLANLRPAADGTVEIPLAACAGRSVLQVLAVDGPARVGRLLLGPGEAAGPARRDLRLMRGLDPAIHVAQRQEVKPLPAGTVLEVADPATARLGWIADRARAWSLLRELGDDATLDQWDFLLRWESTPEAERREKLGEYASHELHLFIARRDPAWFAATVLPLLRQKRERSFVDRVLLGEDVRDWLRPAAFATLNALEQVLLAEALGGEAATAIARGLADRAELAEDDPEERHRRFLTMLGGEGGDLGGADDGGPGGGGGSLSASNLMMADRVQEESCAKPEMNLEELSAAPPPPPPMAAKSAAPPGGERLKKSRSSDLARRGAVRPLFRQLDTTQEWGESHWWKKPLDACDADLVPVCAFWADAARWIADGRKGPFLSPHLDQVAGGGRSAILGALALLDLPAAAMPPAAEEGEGGSRYRLASHALLASRQTMPCAGADAAGGPLLINQYVVRHDDREDWVDGARVERPVTGEFLVNAVYISVVVLTNPGLARLDVDLLAQIPRGSLPCQAGARSRCQPVRLEPGSTQRITTAFYFPAPGEFAQFPAHASQAGRLLAHAPPQRFRVLERPSAVDARSWAQVAGHGTAEQVLAFLDGANPGRIDLDLVLWRCRDRAFWKALVARLRARACWHPDVWGQALAHRDDAALAEWLETQDEVLACLGEASSPWIRRPDRIPGGVQHLEYAPLVNARAHRLGDQARIQNDRFGATWRRTLERLAERPALTDDDRLVLAVYLLLQDRHAEAVAVAESIATPTVQLPMDYLRCFIAFIQGRPAQARAIAERHLQLPLRRWRERFADVIAQLDEIEGRGAAVAGAGQAGPEQAARAQAALAAGEPSLAIRAAMGRGLRVVSRHLSAVRVNCYPMDLELLFSRQPFMQGDARRFACIAPAWSGDLALGADGADLELPERFAAANLMVEVVATAGSGPAGPAGLRAWQAVYANRLRVQVQEAYGQLQVLHDAAAAQPLPAVYVKVFARMQGGEVRFYKDGYTDLRGRFDYASLSTDDLTRVERFALLILHREHGGLVQECAPPPR